jgi:hypothetical protein
MNKLYIIVPLVLTLAFGGVYFSHSKDAAAKAETARLEAEQAAAVAAKAKAEAEAQARKDADERTAQRLAEEKKKEEEKAAKWAAQSQTIADDTATYLAQAEKNAAEIQALEAKLAALRAEKDKAVQAGFDFDLEIEKARVAKRTAELEIQRLVEMTARKAGTTLGSVAATP